jgi:hypothetical protein
LEPLHSPLWLAPASKSLARIHKTRPHRSLSSEIGVEAVRLQRQRDRDHFRLGVRMTDEIIGGMAKRLNGRSLDDEDSDRAIDSVLDKICEQYGLPLPSRDSRGCADIKMLIELVELLERHTNAVEAGLDKEAGFIERQFNAAPGRAKQRFSKR